jgi:hypothetical protein
VQALLIMLIHSLFAYPLHFSGGRGTHRLGGCGSKL